MALLGDTGLLQDEQCCDAGATAQQTPIQVPDGETL